MSERERTSLDAGAAIEAGPGHNAAADLRPQLEPAPIGAGEAERGDRWRIELVAAPHAVPGIMRLKRALKVLLRSFALRCVEVLPAPAQERAGGAAARPQAATEGPTMGRKAGGAGRCGRGPRRGEARALQEDSATTNYRELPKESDTPDAAEAVPEVGAGEGAAAGSSGPVKNLCARNAIASARAPECSGPAAGGERVSVRATAVTGDIEVSDVRNGWRVLPGAGGD